MRLEAPNPNVSESFAWGGAGWKARLPYTLTVDMKTVHAKPWMNWLAPLARPIFEWNHNVLMRWGEKGLKRLLES